ncbi:hypothetical protein PDE_07427 [Penicillium oxalicum 114-2]|uniref:Uncharacterized protein n=1 Tax=Penicillium oxalicum (strain 114-2 / CGMCC 5302) TaxID=933388 RepID=S8BC44_PENO1|nr:hypothetical protein PDE_07427 [Penicillium oxalicum 114-2]
MSDKTHPACAPMAISGEVLDAVGLFSTGADRVGRRDFCANQGQTKGRRWKPMVRTRVLERGTSYMEIYTQTRTLTKSRVGGSVYSTHPPG